ncbi:hypothetical protein HK100_001477 [Physocladia obscura]|uniref:Uncharacterized protein n=1 Tax=Physocladia obscura TaxID=109957 RepID=A0AAD5T8D1_9FUNG|nr:hypothetical protein HK100_001477 [Physocladia obscura]
MALSAEHEFLRHRLAQLDFREPFSADSFALVRHLLADLVQTTDSAAKFKAEAERARKEKHALAEQNAPLRAELARLTAENNQVHLDLIRLSDDRDARDKRAAQTARNAAIEISELKFMVAQYSQKLAGEQRRGEEERAKAEEAFQKMGLFSTSAVTAKNSASIEFNVKMDKKKRDVNSLFERLQKIDLDTGLAISTEPMTGSSSQNFNPPPPVAIDALRITQARVEQLETTLNEVSNQNADLENEIQTVRDQVATREQEIMRLGAQLELSRAQQFSSVQIEGRPLGYLRDEGAPLTPAETIHQLPLARQRISQLELQIEHLQEHIDSLEKERAGVSDEKAQFALGFEDERRFLKMEIEEEREKNIKMLEATKELEKMVGELIIMKEGIEKSAAKKIGDREGKLEKANDELRIETENLLRKVSNLESIVLEKSTRVNFLEHEIENFRNRSPTQNLAQNLESKITELTNQINDRDNLKNGLERDLQNLRRQLEFAMKNNEKAEEIILAHSRLQVQKQELDQEFESVKKERDDLINVLRKFEEQLTDMHEAVQQLTSDRDNFSLLYRQAHSEVQNLRARISGTEENEQSADSVARGLNSGTKIPRLQSGTGSKLTPAAKSSNSPKPRNDTLETKLSETISKLEEAKARVQILEGRERELEDEVMKLQGDLKAVIFRQREAGVNAGETIRQIEIERDRLRENLENKAVIVTALEEKAQLLNEKLNFKDLELSDKDRKMDDLRNGIAMMEMNLNDATMQLKDARSKLHEAQTKLNASEQELTQIQQQTRQQQEKIGAHSELLAQVDQDRDRFRNEVDAAVERISELNSSLSSTKNELQKSQSELAQAYENLDQMNRQLNDQDHEVAGLQSQIRIVSSERDRFANEVARANEDLRNLSTDLTAMTRENQSLNGELSQLAREREALKSDLSECESQIKYLDALVREKDNEKDHAMSSYMKICTERDRLNIQIRSAAEEVNELRMEVIMRDKRVVQIQREYEELQGSVGKLKIDLNAYEKQCSNLTKSLATSERNCKNLDTEKQRLLREISAVRELAQSFDRNRENLQRELSATKIESERMERNLEKVITEQDNLVNELRNEKIKYERLEGLLAVERTKKMAIENSKIEMMYGQQAASLAAATRDVTTANEQLVNAQRSIERLDFLLAEKHAELQNCQKIIDMKVTSPDRERDPGDSQTLARSIKNETELEKKIQSELESTKEQLRIYEIHLKLNHINEFQNN